MSNKGMSYRFRYMILKGSLYGTMYEAIVFLGTYFESARQSRKCMDLTFQIKCEGKLNLMGVYGIVVVTHYHVLCNICHI